MIYYIVYNTYNNCIFKALTKGLNMMRKFTYFGFSGLICHWWV